jgi:hypothetical protein
MDEQMATPLDALRQPVSRLLTADFIKQLAQSPRSDDRVLLALLTLAAECAVLDRKDKRPLSGDGQ